MIIRLVILIACLPAMAAAQTAEPAADPAGPPPSIPTESCVDIITLPANMPPYSPVMINHCSGQSWMLGHEDISDGTGKPTGEFVYRWYPLNAAAEEAYLVKAGALPTPTVRASGATPNAAVNQRKK